MLNRFKVIRWSVAVFGFVLALAAVENYAQDKREMGGWEKGSAFDQLYDYREMDSFKGDIVDIKEVVPMPGMAPGIAIVVRERGGDDETLVLLCPKWFADRQNIGVKKGDRVKVKGVWVEIDGEDVFIASKVKRGDFFEFKVRLTKDGTPFWTMSPEELAKERQQSQGG